MNASVKICGLSTAETLDAALDAGADFVGFVHFPRSPRHVGLEQGSRLSALAKGRALRVALVVDASDDELDKIVSALDPDILQLHGGETPQHVAAIRSRFGRPVMKAVGIGSVEDLDRIDAYGDAADYLLLDAKPPQNAATLPGGNGIPFDWRLLAGLDPGRSFMLSGGLHPGNVAAAIGLTGAKAVDVSSGVESRPGEKDPTKIEAFIKAARAAWAAANDKARQA